MRVTPVAPEPVIDRNASPLGRSGITARDLLTAPDLIVVRSRTPAIALGVGLEQARGALIRNEPADALTALDEVWEGARHTETGWYLRGGSLALLGLPAEAIRVANQLLTTRANSIANRFLLSLAKLAAGDLSGARIALGEATVRRPGDALLMVQDALLLARQGNRTDAEQLLNAAGAAHPEHSAIAYGRSLLPQAMRDGARVFDEPLGAQSVASRTPHSGLALYSIDVPGENEIAATGATESSDLVHEALARVGARLPLLGDQHTVAECRALLIGLSSAGPIAASVTAARAYAARSVLGAIIDALQNSDKERGLGWDARSVDGHWQRLPGTERGSETETDVFRATVRALTSAMRDGRTNDAEAILRRPDTAIDDPRRMLLREFAGLSRAPHATVSHVQGLDGESALLSALRLGLGLLPAHEAVIASRRVETRAPVGASDAFRTDQHTANSAMLPQMRGDEGGTVGLIGALLLLASAVYAFSTSHAVIGFACVGLAGWIAVRQGAVQRDARRKRANGPWMDSGR